MSDAGEVMFRVASLSLIVAGWLTGTWTWRARHRWGLVRAPATVVGEGPYRRAITSVWRPRGTPVRIALVAGMGIAWGILTCALFAPAGLVFLLAPAHIEPGMQMLLTMAGLGVFATAISGLALGGALVRASRALIDRAPDVIDQVMPVAMWSGVHHLLVLSAFALFAIHERDAGIVAAVAVPCSIGIAHAWALAHGARFASRARDADVAPHARDGGDFSEGDRARR